MSIRNLSWFNLQSTRRYPLDDNSTGTDDRGVRLNDAIIADISLRFPSSVARYAYIGGITVTDSLVTVVILGADAPDDSAGFVPLAAITARKPVIAGRNYSLDGLADGVGGWIVFGYGIDTPFSARFSAPIQSLLTPKCARWYRPAPVTSISRYHSATRLTGLVKLQASPDLEINKETVYLEGANRDAIVFRLAPSSGDRVTLQEYAGPCSNRPESYTCDQPPVEFINTVGPDCDGNIDIEVRGIDIGAIDDCGGAVLDHYVGLEEACTPKPRKTSYTDLCLPSLETSSSVSESSSSISEIASSVSDTPCGDSLPYLETFTGGALDLTTVSGSFAPDVNSVPGDPAGEIPNYVMLPTSTRPCIALFETDCAYSPSVELICQADLSWQQSLSLGNPRREGGLIINWHITNPLTNPKTEYFYAALDFDAKRLFIYRYNGSILIAEGFASVPTLKVDHWYRMKVFITYGPTPATQVSISVHLSLYYPIDPAFFPVTLTLVTTQYYPADGLFGIGTNGGCIDFGYFRLNNYPE